MSVIKVTQQYIKVDVFSSISVCDTQETEWHATVIRHVYSGSACLSK